MSTATNVPETWELTGDDAREALVRVGRLNLMHDAYLRLRYADGFSHARSMAFPTPCIYGDEQDRPPVQKYATARLAVTAGVCVSGAFILFAFAHGIGREFGSEARVGWDIARWPLAVVLVVAGMSVLFRRSPRRHQPAFSWLAYSAALATLLWSAVTLLLGTTFGANTTFGEMYGPLAGIVALQLWTFFSAVGAPQDTRKAEDAPAGATTPLVSAT